MEKFYDIPVLGGFGADGFSGCSLDLTLIKTQVLGTFYGLKLMEFWKDTWL